MPTLTDDTLLAGLNPAQREAVLKVDGPLLVLAGAGSGKTKVLTTRIARIISHHGVDPSRILAVTFTNKAAGEMRERIARILGHEPAGMWMGTFHSLGARLLRQHAMDVGRTPAFTIYDQDDTLAVIKRLMERHRVSPKDVAPSLVQNLISEAKNALTSPDEYAILARDPVSRAVSLVYNDLEGELRRANAVDFDGLLVLPVELLRNRPELREKWAQRFQYVLVDEYQDTNQAQYSFVKLVGSAHGNVCVVGDDDQCLVRGTPVTMADGSVRPIEEVDEGDLVRSAFGSGRFGASRVLRVHAKRHAGEAVAITVEDSADRRRRLVSTPEHTHFAGFIPGETPRLHFSYLMYKRGVGYRVGTTQMYTAGQRQPVPGYQLRVAQEHADALWIVGVHDDERAARLDEYLVALRYQLPMLPFKARESRNGDAAAGLVHDPVSIARVFAALDTESGAERLLADRGLSREAPHYLPRSRNSSRRNVVLTLCGDRRGARPMHRISMVGNDSAGRDLLEGRGLGVRAAKAESASWRHETARTSYAALLEEVDAVRGALGEVNVVRMARLGRTRDGHDSNSLPFTPAGSVLRGMSMFGADGELLRVVATERVRVDDTVYDLDVEDTHNFVADGVVTHNSIYGWRGADIRNILNFNKDFPDAHVVRLEENYRSKPPILELANQVIQANAGRMGKTLRPTTSGGERVTSVMALDERDEADFVVEEIRARRGASGTLDLRDFALLYRTNAQSRALEEALRRHGMPYRIIGSVRFYDRREIRDLMSYLKLIANPADDEAFRRAVAVPRRGVGDTTLDTLAERARAEGLPMFDAVMKPDLLEGLRAATRAALEGFVTLVRSFREKAKEAAVDELLRDLVESIRYGDYLKAEGEETAKERLDNVRELITSAAETMIDEGGEVGLTPLDHFLQRVSLVAAVDALDADADAVTLMTLHNAKGLEFPYVFLTGLEDGLFPLARAYDDPKLLEEERRLFYVGITRARVKLYLSHAQGRLRNGEFSPSKPSKFLIDVPDAMLEKKSTIKVRSSGRAFMSGHGGAYNTGWGRTGGERREREPSWEEKAFSPNRRDRVQNDDDIFPPSPAARRPGVPVRRAMPDPSEESQVAAVIAPGARVKHRKFGTGTIAEVSGAGRDAKAKIDFDDEEVGRKTLVVAQANLERADD